MMEADEETDGRNRRFGSLRYRPDRLLKRNVPRKMQELKLAFSEFYLSLILLQNYQNLNFTGFRKILKKHDKVSQACCAPEKIKGSLPRCVAALESLETWKKDLK